MPRDRWDGDVHHYEYDALERYQGMDAFKVAEAYIYNAVGFALGVILVVSAQELHAGVKPDEAIRTARQHLRTLISPDVAGSYHDVAQALTENRGFLHSWNGAFVRKVL